MIQDKDSDEDLKEKLTRMELEKRKAELKKSEQQKKMERVRAFRKTIENM